MAWEMINRKQPLAPQQDKVLAISPLLSFFHALLNVQRRTTPSPSHKHRKVDDSLDGLLTRSISKSSVGSLSLSPFKTPKALTSFSLDLNHTTRTNRSQSSYRMETDRVNRLTRYCESLERKAIWASLRETKRAEHQKVLIEREQSMRQQFILDRSFQQSQKKKEMQQKRQYRNDRESSFRSEREAREKLRREEAKRRHDDLQRSVRAI